MTSSNETPETETAEETPRAEEPIDVEFEPASQTEAAPAPPKAGVGMATVAACSIGAAMAGGAIGVIGSGSSNIDTAKFAPAEIRTEIDDLIQNQNGTAERLTEAMELASLTEARFEGKVAEITDRFSAFEAGDVELRSEFEALNAQLDALIGPATVETMPQPSADEETADVSEQTEASLETPFEADASSPLARLIARISYLEERLAEADESPETTGQLRRALNDVSSRIETIEKAGAEIERAASIREQAIQSLQSDVFAVSQSVSEVEDSIIALSAADNVSQKTEDTEAIAALRAEIASIKGTLDTQATDSEISSTPQPTVVAPTPTGENNGTTSVEEVTSIVEQNDEAPAAIVPDSAEDQARKLSDSALAVAQLESQSSRGKPFPSAWDRLAGILTDNANVDALRELSRRGAPTLSELRTSFAPIRTDLDKLIADRGKGDGWDWARQAFGGVVTVRRTDAEGDSPEAVVARITTSLDDGNLLAAVENADKLEGFSHPEFDQWLIDANARLSLETNLAAIRQSILDESARVSEGN